MSAALRILSTTGIALVTALLLIAAPRTGAAQEISIGLKAGVSGWSAPFREKDPALGAVPDGYSAFTKGLCFRTRESRRLIVELGIMHDNRFESPTVGTMFNYSSHVRPNPATQYFERKVTQLNLTIQYRLPGLGRQQDGFFRFRHAIGPGATSMHNTLVTTTSVYSKDTATLEMTQVERYTYASLWLGIFYSPSFSFSKHVALFGTFSYQLMVEGDGNPFRKYQQYGYGSYLLHRQQYPQQLLQGAAGLRYTF